MGNREVALALAAAGLAVFPCHSGGPEAKRPLRGVFWRSSSTTDTSKIHAWWDRHGDAVPAIDLAKSGFVVIDADRHGGPDGVAAWQSLCRQHGVPPHPTDATPSGGLHSWFRQPADPIGNSRGTLPPGVDVRGVGGYVIAPGAVMQDGSEYRLVGSLDDAPPLPAWLEALLRARREEAPPPSAGSPPSDRYAAAALDQEIAAVRQAGPGTRNQQLNTSAFSLGQLVGAGALSAADVSSALEQAAHDNGLVKDDGIRSVRASIRSGLTAGQKQPRQVPAPSGPGQQGDIAHGAAIARALVEHADGTIADAETGEVVDDAAPAAGEAFPEALTHPPGLLGSLVDWMTATATRPSRALNLGVSLAFLGALFGRRFAGPTGNGLRTNLYIVTLAASGFGKTHPMACVAELAVSAGVDHLLGGDRIKSDAGLRNRLEASGSVLYLLDEVDGHFRPWLARQAKAHHSNIRDMVLSLFSAAATVYRGDDYGDRSTEPIINPNLCLYGTTTHARFWRALEGGTLEDGFLPRFVLVDAGATRPAAVDVAPSPVPAGLIGAVQAASGLRGRANLRGVVKAGSAWPSARVAPWGPGGRELWADTIAALDREQDRADPSDQPFIARIAEHAQKLALVRAVGVDWEAPAISAEDLAWGLEIARASSRMIIAQAADMIADTQAQADYLKVRRIIAQGGQRGRTYGEVVKYLHGAIERRKLEDILRLLTDGGDIELAMIKPLRGPERRAYRRLK